MTAGATEAAVGAMRAHPGDAAAYDDKLAYDSDSNFPPPDRPSGTAPGRTPAKARSTIKLLHGPGIASPGLGLS